MHFSKNVMKKEKKKKPFTVVVKATIEKHIKVKAYDEAEAIQLAHEKFDCNFDGERYEEDSWVL